MNPKRALLYRFKVAENESPLPMDRLFVAYNFYSRVLGTQDVEGEKAASHSMAGGGQARWPVAGRARPGDRVRD